jgi:hypothetical protein
MKQNLPRLAALLALAALVIAGAATLVSASSKHQPPNYAGNAAAYCEEGVASMRRYSDYEDFVYTGMYATTTSNSETTFACPARSHRGAYIVRVRALCFRVRECAAVEAVIGPDGSIVWSATDA